MITITDLYHSFGERAVLRGVDLKFQSGIISGLIGPSGAGKSVLLKILAGVTAPQRGEVKLGSCSIGFMFQEGALFDSLSVQDNVAFPLVNGEVPIGLLSKEKREEVWHKVAEILRSVGLLQAAKKLPAALSGGMRRRAALARALVARPEIAFLDDPTAGLDPVASSVIMELIKTLQEDMRSTVVIVSHDLRRLIPIISEIHALFDGKIIFSGNPKELKSLASPDLFNFIQCRYDLNFT